MRTVRRPDPPTGVRRMLFRLPIQAYRMGLGGLFGRRFLLLHHVGRVSGAPRRVVLEVVEHDPAEGWYVVASGFGTGADWYRNVLAHPEVSIQVGRRTMPARAERLTPDDGGEFMARYAPRHRRIAVRLVRFMGFQVDGSVDDYREVGRAIPFVRLVPQPPAG
ncbi:MAG TPA: nitroreductase family deazaflavin-dependent oxidoreductase [Mycobacteriales bacterium]|nr:nitroreductase family deazaflavin-dependent oxidoreductase [Mycobacteriales bacterium]